MQRTKEVMPQRSTQAKKHDEFSQLRSVIPTMSERSYSAPVRITLAALQWDSFPRKGFLPGIHIPGGEFCPVSNLGSRCRRKQQHFAKQCRDKERL